MDLEQLIGRRLRLKRELEEAHADTPVHTALIDRLTSDLATTETQIAAQQQGNPSLDPIASAR